MTTKIETARLLLRKIRQEDTPALYQLFSDTQLMKYFISGPDDGLDATKKRIESMIGHWERFGFGDYIAVQKGSFETIGFGGLHYKRQGGHVNIAYMVSKEHWGRGFGREMADALLTMGFDSLKLKTIAAEIDPNNLSSIELIEKIGFKYSQTIEVSGHKRLEYLLQRS